MSRELKRAIESGNYPVGTWLSIGHPSVAEISANQDFDFVLIDTEHTSMGLETVENMARGVDAAGETSTVVRVPENDTARIKRVLDIGVGGVMVPMVEDAEEARELVESVRYPPEGVRGVAGGRASTYGLDFPEYLEEAHESILTIVQIETEAGLRNAEEIAAVDGIDALFVGPSDLSASLGLFDDQENPQFQNAVQDVLEAGDRTGIPVGTLTIELPEIESRIEEGFDFLIVGKDTSTLMRGNREARKRYAEAIENQMSVPHDD